MGRESEAYFKAFASKRRLSNVRFNELENYVVSLKLSGGKLYYADRWIEIDRPAMIFSCPTLPYAWEPNGDDRGFTCTFNEQFICDSDRTILSKTPLMDHSLERVIFLSSESLHTIQDLFQRMTRDSDSADSEFRLDAMHCYLHLLLLEVLKVVAHGVDNSKLYQSMNNAAQRIVELFLTLLDRQFPTAYPQRRLDMRSAADYAAALSIHTNHLNRVVKQITGKTTSDIIGQRICSEALRLLRETKLNIGEVAFALGFEEQASFNSFIKRHTGTSPTQYRKENISL